MAFHHPNRSHRKPEMGAKAYPLRKIIGTRMVEIKLAGGKPSGVEILHEVLECGHTMRPRSDFVGETNTTKRRCLQCYQKATGE
jgi:hypothetical protein